MRSFFALPSALLRAAQCGRRSATMPLQFLFRSAAEEEAVALFRQQLVAAVWRPSSDEMHAALAAWEAARRHPPPLAAPRAVDGFARWRARARASSFSWRRARTSPPRSHASERRRSGGAREPPVGPVGRRARAAALAARAARRTCRLGKFPAGEHDNHGASLHHEQRALVRRGPPGPTTDAAKCSGSALLASMRAALAEALEAWRQWRKLHRAESDRRRRALLTWRPPAKAAGCARGARRRRAPPPTTRAPAALRPRSARDSGAPRAARSHSGERGTRRWP